MTATLRALLRAEATKAARQPSTYVLAGILIAYAGLLTIGIATLLAAPTNSSFDPQTLLKPLRADAIAFLTSILGSIATILLVIFTAQTIAQEYARGTLRTLLLHRARRRDIALAKLALLTLASLGLAILVTTLSLLAAATFSAAAHETLLHADAASLAQRTLRIAAALLAWSAIAYGTTLWTRSLGVGIGATLGSLLIGDVLTSLLLAAGDAGRWATRALPNTAIQTLAGNADMTTTSWAWIVPNLIVYVVLLNVLAVRALVKMDVIAATK